MRSLNAWRSLTAALLFVVLLSPPAAKGRKISRDQANVSSTRETDVRKPKRSTPLIGNIEDVNLYTGCGCYFSLPAERRAGTSRYFFRSDMGRRAWMNVDGEDVELRIVGASHMSLKGKRGERMNFRFRSRDGISVRVRMLVTRTSTYEVDYEPSRYAVTIEVVKGRRRQIIRTLNEMCGC